jgi:DNA-binding PadR family transcriptional regulator
MSKRSGILEFAILGLLREAPMHGYELRKRLNTSLGIFRAFSYGSLYPCLKTLVAQGWLVEESGPGADPLAAPLSAPLSGRRAKIVYRLTAAGKEHFEKLLTESGPDAWEDEHFAARFAFFGQTSRDVRVRVLEGRRTRLEERLEKMRASLARTRERLDDYTLELQLHGVESVEREVRWLNDLIETERSGRKGSRAEGCDGSSSSSTSPGSAASPDSASSSGSAGSPDSASSSATARSTGTARSTDSANTPDSGSTQGSGNAPDSPSSPDSPGSPGSPRRTENGGSTGPGRPP